MCVNCMSNAEAAMASAAIAGYLVKGPLHKALAAGDHDRWRACEAVL